MTKAKAAKPEKTELAVQDQKPWLFKPGESGNPAGRPVGSRNKLSEDFLGDLHALWQKQGPDILERVAQEDPAAVMRACVAVLPKQLHIKTDPLDEMTDDQLREHAKRIAAELGPLLAFAGIREDAGKAEGATRH